jgi:hypothetical protein
MTADSYLEWEVSTDGGSSWNSLGMGEKYASASIANNSKYRGKANDYSSFPPSEVYTNIITFTVNGERVGTNTISTPDRGSLNLNGTDQSFLMTPGFAVNTGAFTFEAWFKMNEAPYENQFSYCLAPVIISRRSV